MLLLPLICGPAVLRHEVLQRSMDNFSPTPARMAATAVLGSTLWVAYFYRRQLLVYWEAATRRVQAVLWEEFPDGPVAVQASTQQTTRTQVAGPSSMQGKPPPPPTGYPWEWIGEWEWE
ncbi:hypothetical protein WJX72_002226 [[Myrmecia] bisecta]|uniref:Uncharacterized protein n=1 Tax=[Myrmecia] bisecta TaxID=41462 RepID=A0AAW1PGP6_9CHLO